MDISKFNKLLTLLIQKAERAENNNSLEEAIDSWIEVTELTIKTAKNPKLDFTFRNMLYTRTEGIINHIKELKIRLKQPKPRFKPKSKPIIIESPKIEKKNSIKQNSSNDSISKLEPSKKEMDFEDEMSQYRENKFKAIQKDFEIIKNSDFKDLPKGVKEIKPEKEYKIFTPHDPEYVQNRINQEIDMSVLKPNIEANNNRIELDKKSENGNTICFACGEQNRPNARKCKACGVEL
ncbi:MAG: hypothetical protein KGD63_11335 [Candidatus Lokiarchaeota archaeon]|nr:hypothetical protein [Candidatus Lokiarchaeota archaeon]